MKIYLIIGFITAVINAALVLKHNDNGLNEIYFGMKYNLFHIMLAGLVYVFVWPLCLIANTVWVVVMAKSMKPKKKFLVFRNTKTDEKIRLEYDKSLDEIADQYWLDPDWVIDEYEER